MRLSSMADYAVVTMAAAARIAAARVCADRRGVRPARSHCAEIGQQAFSCWLAALVASAGAKLARPAAAITLRTSSKR
jgi:hypothetical protein